MIGRRSAATVGFAQRSPDGRPGWGGRASL